MKTYEDGLNEAWELARRIVCSPPDGGATVEWLENTFGTGRTDLVLRNFSASEAIDATENYEELKVGDEVIDKYGWKRVVTGMHNSGEITVMGCNGESYDYCKKAVMSDFKKTGRHYSQLEEILKQLEDEE